MLGFQNVPNRSWDMVSQIEPNGDIHGNPNSMKINSWGTNAKRSLVQAVDRL